MATATTEGHELRLLRKSATEFVREWLDEIGAEFRRPVEPQAIRALVLQHIGALPIPPGPKMGFVVRSIETLLQVVDWDQVAYPSPSVFERVAFGSSVESADAARRDPGQ